MRKRLALAIGVAAMAGVFAPGAAADPINANSSTSGLLNVVCGDQAVTLAVNGNGQWSSGHDIIDTSVFSPRALNIILTFTPADGGPPSVDHAIVSKNSPSEATVDCTIPLQIIFSGPQGTRTIEGTITGLWTPR